MVGTLSEDVDRLISVGLDAVGSFDENTFGVEYAQEDVGATRYSTAEGCPEPVSNEHYLG